MGVLRYEFEERSLEIDAYFDLVEKVEQGYKSINNNVGERIALDDKLEKILKSTGFVLLYNLIESTIFNSIIDIFDEIQSKNLSYSHVNDHIKRYWLKHQLEFDNKSSKHTIVSNFHSIIDGVLKTELITLSKEHIEYGGSLESTKIKELSKEIGVELTHFKCKKNDNSHISFECIKKNRNDLAHGKQSFSELAKDITYKGSVITRSGGGEKIISYGLVHYKKFIIASLDKYIQDIEEYINNEKYLV